MRSARSYFSSLFFAKCSIYFFLFMRFWDLARRKLLTHSKIVMIIKHDLNDKFKLLESGIYGAALAILLDDESQFEEIGLGSLTSKITFKNKAYDAIIKLLKYGCKGPSSEIEEEDLTWTNILLTTDLKCCYNICTKERWMSPSIRM